MKFKKLTLDRQQTSGAVGPKTAERAHTKLSVFPVVNIDTFRTNLPDRRIKSGAKPAECQSGALGRHATSG